MGLGPSYEEVPWVEIVEARLHQNLIIQRGIPTSSFSLALIMGYGYKLESNENRSDKTFIWPGELVISLRFGSQ